MDNRLDQIYCAVINADANSTLLASVPHEKMEDLAVVVKERISDRGSILIANDLCNKMQMTPEEVLEVARKNSEEKEYECVPIGDMIQSILAPEELPDAYTEDIRAETTKAKMYVITNREKWEGAAAILSPRALEAAREKMGENYYILPSSRHELILLPESTPMNVEEMQKVVRDINGTIVRKEDRLSDNVYKYDSETKKVSLATGRERTLLKEPGEKPLKSHTRSH